MRTDEVETLLRDHMTAEAQRIVPPAGLEQDVMRAIETAASSGAQPHGILRQLAWSAGVLALVIGIAGGAAWLRLHNSASFPAPSVSASASPIVSGNAVPDAASGSAVGYYAPGGYPILANQQTTGGQGFTTWKWNGSRWIELIRGSGSPSVGGNMVYDPAIRMTVVLGGSSGFTGWNGSAWVALPSPPSIQGQPYLAFDQRRNQLLLMDSSQAGATTWTYDRKAWKKLDTAAGPRGDFGGGVAYDPRNGTTILFGGVYIGQSVGDTWEWNGSTWTQLHPTNSPPAGNAVMAFDPATQQMLLLAQDGTAWTWVSGNWSPLASAVTPPKGAYAGLVYDSSRQVLLLWEGATGYEQGSQTWSYSGGTWVRRS